MAVGWNIADVGAIATRLSHDYHTSLATIGLFTTALFVVHALMQIPGGRAADRFGARETAILGLGLIAAGNAIALIAPQVWLALSGRAVIGLGTSLCLVPASDYIRAIGGGPFLQGVYGSGSVLAPGIALLVVPPLADAVGFRAPFLAAIVAAGIVLVLLALAPSAPRTPRHAGERFDWGFFRDSRLYRFAAIHTASFSFSVIAGNWVVTLLERHGHSKTAAAATASLTLLLGFFTRIGGGSLLAAEPRLARRWVAASLVAGGAGAVVLAAPLPFPVLVAAAAVIGLGAGIPFAMAFTGAARVRPEAPGAAVGFVNGWAALAIVVGTPLLGLTFSLPGNGRIGFLVLGLLAALAAAATPRSGDLEA